MRVLSLEKQGHMVYKNINGKVFHPPLGERRQCRTVCTEKRIECVENERMMKKMKKGHHMEIVPYA